MSRLFGWSYPPGCSGPPDEVEPVVLRCKHCGCFLPRKPVRQEPWEDSCQCNGEDSDGMCGGPDGEHEPHKIIFDQGSYDVYECHRCILETKI